MNKKQNIQLRKPAPTVVAFLISFTMPPQPSLYMALKPNEVGILNTLCKIQWWSKIVYDPSRSSTCKESQFISWNSIKSGNFAFQLDVELVIKRTTAGVKGVPSRLQESPGAVSNSANRPMETQRKPNRKGNREEMEFVW